MYEWEEFLMAMSTAQVPSVNARRTRNRSLWMLLIGAAGTLFTYQYFHHGLWGKLNNYNKLPMVALKGSVVQGSQLHLELYRPNGPDTYGSFVEQVSVSAPGGTASLETWTPKMLAGIAPGQIHNVYHYQQIKTGPWGLVVPLAAKATVQLPLSPSALTSLKRAGQAQITVEDVSGVDWTYVAPVK